MWRYSSNRWEIRESAQKDLQADIWKVPYVTAYNWYMAFARVISSSFYLFHSRRAVNICQETKSLLDSRVEQEANR